MESNPKGIEVNNIFKYVSQVLQSVQILLEDLDFLMQPEWEPGHNDVSQVLLSFGAPEHWLIRNVARLYESDYEFIKKGITVVLWGDEIIEPVLIAGKIEYKNEDEKDLWGLWHAWENTRFNDDYDLQKIKTYETLSMKVTFFELPLLSVQDKNGIEEKIIIPLKDL